MKKILIVTTSLAVGLTASAFAAGFGVAGENKAQSQNINQLISSATPQPQAPAAPAAPPAVGVQAAPGAVGVAQAAPNAAAASTTGLGAPGVSQTAFVQTVKNMMPLSPDQIKTLRYLFDQSQRAASQYPGTPPKPTSSSVMVNLSPGAAPPVVRLRAGFVTSLVFLDSTGQPWPIVAYDLGNPKAFNVEPNQPDGKSSTVLVEALNSYETGNIAVMLKGQDTPVMVTLMPGQTAVDYRVDLRVPGLGPNAKPMEGGGLPAVSDPELLTFLNGVPAEGAKTLQVLGGPGQAWSYHKHMYLRTTLTLLSPSWTATMSSPDGTHVYELQKAPVVLVSQQGKMTQLTIKGL